MKDRIKCDCGWSALATEETQLALALEHLKTHRQDFTCGICGEWLEFCGCREDSDGD